MAHDFIGLPNDGAGKKLHTHSHIHDGTEVHNQVMSLGYTDEVDDTLSALARIDPEGALYVRNTEGSQLFDGFGKSKFSTESYIGNYNHKDGLHPDTWFYYASTNNADTKYEHLTDVGGVKLQTGSDLGDTAYMQTHLYHSYNAGTSNLFLGTFAVGDTGKDGVVRRWGLFDGDDGLFFELNGTDLKFVVRSDATGSIVDTPFERTSWTDKLDGTGISKMTIDVSKDNIYWFDYQYLGAGRVRFGVFDEHGVRRVCGHIDHANQLNHSYMSRGDLPYRVEQLNTVQGVSVSQLNHFLGAVVTEGSTINLDVPAFFGYANTKTVGNNDGEVPVLSVRAKSTLDNGTKNTRILVPWEITLANTTDAPAIIRVYWSMNPSIGGDMNDAGITWINPSSASGFEVTTDGDGYVNPTGAGRLVMSGYVPANSVGTRDFTDRLTKMVGSLKLHASGANYVFTLMMTMEIVGSGTNDVFASLNWKEY